MLAWIMIVVLIDGCVINIVYESNIHTITLYLVGWFIFSGLL